MRKHNGIEDYIVMNAMQSMLVLQLWLVTSKQNIQIFRAMIITSATILWTKFPEKRILGKACYKTHRRETLYMQ